MVFNPRDQPRHLSAGLAISQCPCSFLCHFEGDTSVISHGVCSVLGVTFLVLRVFLYLASNISFARCLKHSGGETSHFSWFLQRYGANFA